MEKKHRNPNVFKDLEPLYKKKKENDNQQVDEYNILYSIINNGASTSSGNFGSLKVPLKQNTEKIKFKTIKKTMEITEALVNFLIADMLPYSLVEKEGFRSFLKTISPTFSIPQKKFIRSKCEKLYEGTMEIIKNEIKLVSHVALSINFWIKSENMHLAVFCHYITEDWKLKTANIYCKEVSLTYVNLKNVLLYLITNWNIRDKISACTIDDRLVKPDLATINSMQILSCFGTTLNNIITTVLSSNPLVNKVKKMQTEIVNNPNVQKQFNDLQNNGKMEFFSTEISNNWWSILKLIRNITNHSDMFNRIICNAAIGNGQYHLDERELHQLAEIAKNCISYENLSENLTEETFIAASIVFPVKKKLTTGKSSEFQKTIVKEMEKIYKKKSFIFFKKTTFFDPRFKHLCSKFIKTINLIRDEILNETKYIEDKMDKPAQFGLGAIFQKEENSSQSSVISKIQCELNQYLRFPSLDVKENPFEWWKTHKDTFPRLALLAKKYLCASATCNKPKMIFCKGESLFEDNRFFLTSDDNQIFSLFCNKDYLTV